jgi:cytochrome c peroxidase
LTNRNDRKPAKRDVLAAVLSSAALLVSCSISLAADEPLQKLKSLYKRPTQIPFPTSNPYTPEKAALGKALFFDPRLSGAENMNCASCHNPSFGWEVPVKTAVGAMNVHLGRQAPTVLNTAWNGPFFWDGRAATAEAQAKGPIEAPEEMNLPLGVAVKRLNAIAGYKAWFDRVFPDVGVTPDTIAAAIATFERTVVASYAPFDAWIDGDESAISASAKEGFALFNGKGKCADCHTGWNLTDNKFHDIGTTLTDIGRAAQQPENPAAKYAFKTPTLRDIAQRGPYGHSGQYGTLEAIMVHYVQGGIDRPSRSPLMRPVALSAKEIDDIIAFMHSLTGSRQVVTLPVLPN